MKRLVASVVLAFGLILGAVVLPRADAAAPEGSCSVTWGSQAKSAGPGTTPFSLVEDARTGRHACFDRFVIDLTGSARGYHVRYVRRFRPEGGEVVRLPGQGKIEIVVNAPAHDLNYRPSYPGVFGRPLPGVHLNGYETFRSARFGGSFEGYTTFGLGVRARLPFRVFKLPGRVVIDVAHHW